MAQGIYYIDRPIDPTQWQPAPGYLPGAGYVGLPQTTSTVGNANTQALLADLRGQFNMMAQTIAASMQQFTTNVSQSIQSLSQAVRMTGVAAVQQAQQGFIDFRLEPPVFNPLAAQWMQVLPPGPMRVNYMTPSFAVPWGFWNGAGFWGGLGRGALLGGSAFAGLTGLGYLLFGPAGLAATLKPALYLGGAGLIGSTLAGSFQRPQYYRTLPLVSRIGILGAWQAARAHPAAVQQLPNLMPEEVAEFGLSDLDYRLRGAGLAFTRGALRAATAIAETYAFMSGGPLSIPISFLLGPAVGYLATGRIEDALRILDLSHVGEMALINYGPRIAPLGMGTGVGGWGFSQQDRARLMERIISDMYFRRSLRPLMEESLTVLTTGLQLGLFDYSRTTDEFLRRHRELLQASRVVRRALHMSLEEAMVFMKEQIAEEGLKLSGTEITMHALELRQRALRAGLTPEELWRFGSAAAMGTRGTLVAPGVAAENVQRLSEAFGLARARGYISPALATKVGGPGQAAQELYQASVAWMANTPMGRAVLYYITDEHGNVVPTRLAAVAAGRVGPGALMAQGLGGPEKMLALTYRYRTGEFLNEMPPGTIPGLAYLTAYISARSLAPSLGISTTPENLHMLTGMLLMQQGFRPDQIEVMRQTLRTLPQALEEPYLPAVPTPTFKTYLQALMPGGLVEGYYETKAALTRNWLDIARMFTARGVLRMFGYRPPQPMAAPGLTEALEQSGQPKRMFRLLFNEQFNLHPVDHIDFTKYHGTEAANLRAQAFNVLDQYIGIGQELTQPSLLAGVAIRDYDETRALVVVTTPKGYTIQRYLSKPKAEQLKQSLAISKQVAALVARREHDKDASIQLADWLQKTTATSWTEVQIAKHFDRATGVYHTGTFGIKVTDESVQEAIQTWTTFGLEQLVRKPALSKMYLAYRYWLAGQGVTDKEIYSPEAFFAYLAGGPAKVTQLLHFQRELAKQRAHHRLQLSKEEEKEALEFARFFWRYDLDIEEARKWGVRISAEHPILPFAGAVQAYKTPPRKTSGVVGIEVGPNIPYQGVAEQIHETITNVAAGAAQSLGQRPISQNKLETLSDKELYRLAASGDAQQQAFALAALIKRIVDAMIVMEQNLPKQKHSNVLEKASHVFGGGSS